MNMLGAFPAHQEFCDKFLLSRGIICHHVNRYATVSQYIGSQSEAWNTGRNARDTVFEPWLGLTFYYLLHYQNFYQFFVDSKTDLQPQSTSIKIPQFLPLNNNSENAATIDHTNPTILKCVNSLKHVKVRIMQ